MLSQTPPMGWNSWNTFGKDISDSLIRETADAMARNGLRDAGYQYVTIDDLWSERQRDENGRLRPDARKFPHGMEELSRYLHSKSFKFGMYSCAGTRTCADFPGSYEYEFLDAETFAQWGVDLLKYDYCYKPNHVEGHLLYKRMAMALRSCGRDILLSACSWGKDGAETFMRNAGAHMWRSTGDISDNWQSVKGIIEHQKTLTPYGAPGCFNDMDMLVVGMRGKGNVALGGCTDEEYKTHFSAWCLFASPLIIGCDVRKVDGTSLQILTNRELIAVDQDPEGREPWIVTDAYDILVCMRPLANGNYALGFFNLSDDAREVYQNFWDLGLPTGSGYRLFLRDLWAHEDVGAVREGWRVRLEPHACAVYGARLVKG